MTTDDDAARLRELIADLRREVTTLFDSTDRRYEQRFKDQANAVTAALLASDKAVTKAETAAEKRFDAANEFRGQLADQARTFMPRQEAEARLANMAELLAAITAKQDRVEHKGAGLKEGWAYLVGGLGAIGAAVTIVIEVVLRFRH